MTWCWYSNEVTPGVYMVCLCINLYLEINNKCTSIHSILDLYFNSWTREIYLWRNFGRIFDRNYYLSNGELRHESGFVNHCLGSIVGAEIDGSVDDDSLQKYTI